MSSSYKLALISDDSEVHLKDLEVDYISGSIRLKNGTFEGLDRQFWHFQEQKQSGINAGDFPAQVWVNRRLNTSTDGTVSSKYVELTTDGGFRLHPGKYWIQASSPACGVGFHQIRWWNQADKIVETVGTHELAHSAQQMNRSALDFVLYVETNPKKYYLQHCCTIGRQRDGLGSSASIDNSIEVYSTVRIVKLA